MTFGYNPELCNGPACPGCGCRDTHIPPKKVAKPAATGSWFRSGRAGSSDRATCRHCGLAFTFQEAAAPEPLAPFPGIEMPVPHFPGNVPDLTQPEVVEKQVDHKVVAVVKCPECGEIMKTSSTRKTFRYHKCTNSACGCTTKTAR
jgi:hypothetical protein